MAKPNHEDIDRGTHTYKSLQERQWKNATVISVTILPEEALQLKTTSFKFSVFWGERNKLNRSKVIEGKQNGKVALEAIFFALRQAIYELELPRIIVRTNSKFLCDNVLPNLEMWRREDFLTSDLKKMENAEDLEELSRLLQFIETKFVYVPENIQRPDARRKNRMHNETNLSGEQCFMEGKRFSPKSNE